MLSISLINELTSVEIFSATLSPAALHPSATLKSSDKSDEFLPLRIASPINDVNGDITIWLVPASLTDGKTIW